jgi:hypothetical protein
MNWDAIGAIAELLGAIGVIASLVYLATQIRQSREQMERNTRAMQASAYQQFWGQLNEHMASGWRDPEVAELSRRGLADLSSLDESEAARFRMWMLGMAQSHDNAYYQYRIGMLDEERWQKHRAAVKLFYESPGAVQWWEGHPKELFSSEFVALVEEIVGEEPEQADPRR